jgi:hypothetical protein
VVERGGQRQRARNGIRIGIIMDVDDDRIASDSRPFVGGCRGLGFVRRTVGLGALLGQAMATVIARRPGCYRVVGLTIDKP